MLLFAGGDGTARDIHAARGRAVAGAGHPRRGQDPVGRVRDQPRRGRRDRGPATCCGGATDHRTRGARPRRGGLPAGPGAAAAPRRHARAGGPAAAVTQGTHARRRRRGHASRSRPRSSRCSSRAGATSWARARPHEPWRGGSVSTRRWSGSTGSWPARRATTAGIAMPPRKTCAPSWPTADLDRAHAHRRPGLPLRPWQPAHLSRRSSGRSGATHIVVLATPDQAGRAGRPTHSSSTPATRPSTRSSSGYIQVITGRRERAVVRIEKA